MAEFQKTEGKLLYVKQQRKATRRNVIIGVESPNFHLKRRYLKEYLRKDLRGIVEEKLKEGQCGFRPERGTTDPISSLKMLEKYLEWDQPEYIAFVDLENAFDSLPRKISETLEDPIYCMDRLLIRAIKSFSSKCTSTVRT